MQRLLHTLFGTPKKTDPTSIATTAKSQPRRKSRGLSIVELGLYIVVVALLLGGVLTAFFTVQTNARQAQTLVELNQLYSGVQDLYRTSTSYGTAGTNLLTNLSSAGVIPSATVTTPFGDAVNVVAAVATVGGFVIRVDDFASDNCIDLLTNYVGRSHESLNLNAASFGGTIVLTTAVVTKTGAQTFADPIELDNVITTCNAPTNDVGDLIFEYK